MLLTARCFEHPPQDTSFIYKLSFKILCPDCDIILYLGIVFVCLAAISFIFSVAWQVLWKCFKGILPSFFFELFLRTKNLQLSCFEQVSRYKTTQTMFHSIIVFMLQPYLLPKSLLTVCPSLITWNWLCAIVIACSFRISFLNSCQPFKTQNWGFVLSAVCVAVVFPPQTLATVSRFQKTKLSVVLLLFHFSGAYPSGAFTKSLSCFKKSKLRFVLPLLRVPGVCPSRAPTFLQLLLVAVFRT